jgi:hypothetical protein
VETCSWKQKNGGNIFKNHKIRLIRGVAENCSVKPR